MIFLAKVYFLKQKYEFFTKFKLWKAKVKNQTSRKIKYLRLNNSTKYNYSNFKKFYEEHNIQRYFSIRKTPQQNGMIQRMNRSLNERVRCLLQNDGLLKGLWAEAVNMTCYFINMLPHALFEDKAVKEVWTGSPIDLENLRIFGCPSYMHISSEDRSKLYPKLKSSLVTQKV